MAKHRRYGHFSLPTMTNDELVSLALNLKYDRIDDVCDLAEELAERLQDTLYQLEAMIDGQSEDFTD